MLRFRLCCGLRYYMAIASKAVISKKLLHPHFVAFTGSKYHHLPKRFLWEQVLLYSFVLPFFSEFISPYLGSIPIHQERNRKWAYISKP